jgi:hypothetical protein
MRVLRSLAAFLSVPLVVLAAEAAAVPFSFDWTKVGESEIDLSGFLDAPAGKLGPRTVRDGHLAPPAGETLPRLGRESHGRDLFS